MDLHPYDTVCHDTTRHDTLHLTRVCQLGHNYQSWVKTHTMRFVKSKLKQPNIVFLTIRP
jgi:hypothetical protein